MDAEARKKRTRLNKRHDEDTRAAIKTSQIINRLTNHVLGTLKNEVTKEPTEMSASQVTAALGLLKKVIPDLSATNVQGDIFNYHYVATDKPLSEDEWEQQYTDSLEAPAGPPKSLN